MIFDSLVHPTISGEKNKHGVSTSFEAVERERKSSGVDRLLAVGMPTPCYDHEAYYIECSKYSAFTPVAALTMADPVKAELQKIRDVGFRSVKVHPRSLIGKLSPLHLGDVFTECARLNLRVIVCTYCYSDLRERQNVSLEAILRAVSSSPRTLRLILAHGGVFDLLKVLEFSKYTENLLVDLSSTMMKFPNSSLDNDLHYVVRNFDRKVCVGSDYPDFSLSEFSSKAMSLTKGISQERRNNILVKNLSHFMDEK